MNAEEIYDRRVLIIDDESSNVRLLEEVLRAAGYTNIRGATASRAVLQLYAEFRPDILLLDLHMPGLTGFEVMEQLRPVVRAGEFFPILVLTGDATAESKRRALSGGARDFLTKPFDQAEVVARVRNLLETQTLYRQSQDRNRLLESQVRARTRDLEDARTEVLERLALAAEFRDDNTGRHTQRVGRTSALLAQTLGLPDDEVELIRRAAPLHDVGKIGIPDAILLKPGKLHPDELRVMQTHTLIGGRILGEGRSPLLRLAERIALTHHECWDGGGYPLGLRGDAIPLEGRIVSVADVFDALTHERPYKRAWSADDAAAEIGRLSGRKFDPRVVAEFLQLLRQGLLEPDAPCAEGPSATDFVQPGPDNSAHPPRRPPRSP